ncbi:hypothetical protein Acr_00g0099610 [Actinidia rufa]|uniref:Uncharacterized protein n=1 Tax=Actinidia rufa TaxID=165716 RepID=A0A7J0E0P2_9ERIC|nr:hypothetical protein Acr_00g0099610 [Actinidia rufa]
MTDLEAPASSLTGAGKPGNWRPWSATGSHSRRGTGGGTWGGSGTTDHRGKPPDTPRSLLSRRRPIQRRIFCRGRFTGEEAEERWWRRKNWRKADAKEEEEEGGDEGHDGDLEEEREEFGAGFLWF